MDFGSNDTVQELRHVGEVSIEEGGIIPVTRAAASLGDIMKNETERPVVVTQNGVPIGVILNLDLFKRLRSLARIRLDRLYEEERPREESESASPTRAD